MAARLPGMTNTVAEILGAYDDTLTANQGSINALLQAIRTAITAGTLPTGAATEATLAALVAANHTDLAALLAGPLITMSRSIEFTATFTPAAAYTIGQNMGGLLLASSSPVLAQGTRVKLTKVGLNEPMTTATAAATVFASIFNGAPSVAFVDGTTPTTYNAADAALLRCSANMPAAYAGAINMPQLRSAVLADDVLVGVNGKLNVALFANGTQTYVGPGVATFYAQGTY